MFLDILAFYIEPKENSIFVFKLVEDGDYCKVLKQYYENMCNDEKITELIKGV